jgi:hypothetical protein
MGLVRGPEFCCKARGVKRVWLFPFVGLLSNLALGCKVEIGDECTTAADCSQEEPRLCLTDVLEGFPGGYCTIFNCEPGSCPAEAVCVGYRTSLSDTPECSGALSDTRLERTFCMRSCSSSSDCRSGYACIDLAGPDPWGAEVLERPGRNTKVCALAYSGPDIPEDRPSDVCVKEPGAVPAPSAGQATPPLADAGVGRDASVPPSADAAAPSADAAATPSDAAAQSGDASTQPAVE